MIILIIYVFVQIPSVIYRSINSVLFFFPAFLLLTGRASSDFRAPTVQRLAVMGWARFEGSFQQAQIVGRPPPFFNDDGGGRGAHHRTGPGVLDDRTRRRYGGGRSIGERQRAKTFAHAAQLRKELEFWR